MRIGVSHGMGCYPDRLAEADRGQARAGSVPARDRYCFNLKGRGLVILTSCSHRGVVNAIRQAQAVSGVERSMP